MTKKVIIKELICIAVILLVSAFIAHFNELIFIRSPEASRSNHISLYGDPRESIVWIGFFLLLIKYCFQGLVVLVKQNIVINIAALCLSLWALYVLALPIMVVSYGIAQSFNNDSLLKVAYLSHFIPSFIILLITIGVFSLFIFTIRELILKVRWLAANKFLPDQHVSK